MPELIANSSPTEIKIPCSGASVLVTLKLYYDFGSYYVEVEPEPCKRTWVNEQVASDLCKLWENNDDK